MKMPRFAAAALFAAALALTGGAHAGPQQEKMKACNAQAGDRKGDERKAFMKECLSSKKDAERTAKAAEQEKAKGCNKEANGQKLLGEERKKFMQQCMQG